MAFPFLTTLDVSGAFYGTNSQFTELIKRGSPAGWRRLVLSLNDYNQASKCTYGQGLFDAVVQHSASTIEVLTVESCSFIKSAKLTGCCARCPNSRSYGFLNGIRATMAGIRRSENRGTVGRWWCSGLGLLRA